MKAWMLAAAAALFTTGCANVDTHATFVTKTAIGIADVDSAPSGISIGFQRTEGYLGPRLDDGSVAPVIGYLSTDGGTFNRRVRQIYATGCAAEIVVGAASAPSTGASAPAASACNATHKDPLVRRPLLFATGTTMGIGLGLGEGGTPNLVLGYRRKEASVIPVDRGNFPSVLATHDNLVEARAPVPGRPEVGLGITQYFATGRAASELAGNPAIAEEFRRTATNAVVALRESDRQQLRHMNSTLACLAALSDDLLPKVWQDARLTEALPAAVVDDITKIAGDGGADARARARSEYTDFLVARRNDDAKHTEALFRHRQYVCGLAQR